MSEVSDRGLELEKGATEPRHSTMKAYMDNGHKAPGILDLCSKRRWVAGSCTNSSSIN
jgi:hypothetical protein